MLTVIFCRKARKKTIAWATVSNTFFIVPLNCNFRWFTQLKIFISTCKRLFLFPLIIHYHFNTRLQKTLTFLSCAIAFHWYDQRTVFKRRHKIPVSSIVINSLYNLGFISASKANRQAETIKIIRISLKKRRNKNQNQTQQHCKYEKYFTLIIISCIFSESHFPIAYFFFLFSLFLL